MIVYGALPSPFVRKVLMFAGEKGVEVDFQPGGFGQGGEPFAEASPFGKIPALRVPGARPDGSDYLLADSTAICSYLEARFPENPLIPADPQARGDVMWFDEFADTVLMAAGAKLFFNRVVMPLFMGVEGDLAAADQSEKVDMPRVLDWLEGAIGDKEFLVGDTLTLADIAVVVPFINVREAGFVIEGRYPNIARWTSAIEARPTLARANAKMAASLAQIRAAKAG
jgi:glutathione S-transferase